MILNIILNDLLMYLFTYSLNEYLFGGEGLPCSRHWEYNIEQEIINPVVGRMMDPTHTLKDIHVLTLRRSKYVMLHGRGELRLPIR